MRIFKAICEGVYVFFTGAFSLVLLAFGVAYLKFLWKGRKR